MSCFLRFHHQTRRYNKMLKEEDFAKKYLPFPQLWHILKKVLPSVDPIHPKFRHLLICFFTSISDRSSINTVYLPCLVKLYSNSKLFTFVSLSGLDKFKGKWTFTSSNPTGNFVSEVLIPNNAVSVVLYTALLEYSSHPLIWYNDKIRQEFEELETSFETLIKILIFPAFEILNRCVFCDVLLYVCMVLLIFIACMIQFQERPKRLLWTTVAVMFARLPIVICCGQVIYIKQS